MKILLTIKIHPPLRKLFPHYVVSSVLSVTSLYIKLEAVIPAKAGIQIEKTGFRIKSGMTKSVKSFIRQHTMIFNSKRSHSNLEAIRLH